ncbi:uncharacterized protein EV154DRAFT_476191 [Mucor mucedo]|uniref:uncharacterized protein n=1 Tax=Mucor mucedo TaxID=29922 RepID=UPI0022203A6B|nr:uncharacterized protein EV154DRAFT_476191 [Mucor mucedo]KAI7896545.1 hypothetical protein EV154DRAFT_476191 [Mucor mucedo]
MRKEQRDSQKSIFKSGTEQFFHVGDLINALPDTDKFGASSSDKVRITEERRGSAVFLRVEDHSVKVTDGREYATKTTLNNDSKFTAYREKEAIFLHVEDTSVKVTEGRKQPPVFMHVDDTSSNISENNEEPAHFFHVENTEIRVTKNNVLDGFTAYSRGGIYSWIW